MFMKQVSGNKLPPFLSEKGCISILVFFFNKNDFIYFWLSWACVATCALSLAVARGASSSLQRRSSWLWWPLSLWSAGSGSRGLSGVACGPRAQAQLPCGLWDLPRPGVRPVSPVVAGGFLPAVSPEKFSGLLLKDNFTGYRILCWWGFFLSTLKNISLYSLLAFIHGYQEVGYTSFIFL